jgi:methylthioribose-1-phosphate isomerase
VADAARAISTMQIRGAPLIGAAAMLAATRPTAASD